jgi:S1-C subfamily serine protease
MISKQCRWILVALATAWWVPAQAEPEKVVEAEQKPLVPFPDGTQGRPVFLKTLKTRYETPPTVIGTLQKGWFCGANTPLTWNPKLFGLFSGKLSRIFRGEVEKARYPIPKVSDAIFEEADKAKSPPDLQVGAMIKEVKANLCDNSDSAQGGVYIKVFWQVFAPEAQKVVFETTTEGSYQPEGMQKIPYTAFFENAFASAARNLLAETGFRDSVADVAPVVKASSGSSASGLKIKWGKPSTEPLTKNITTIRSAVVTIVADKGTGSGFFISQDGNLISNAHVVGTARFVKVKLPTGRELVGEVMRTDKARDVALVKTEPIAVQPVSLSNSEPNIGEEVYALGSPLGDKFNTTLTRGILSGYRTIESQRYLQSDVAILPGNSGGPLLDGKGSVVGVTVMGLGAKGLAGMNFFIPIADALAKLGIEAD